jgi:hypothetical protein
LFRVSYESLLLAAIVASWTAAASAQTPAAPPATDDEDLEVPASPTPVAPNATVAAPAAEELPAAPTAQAPQPAPLAARAPVVSGVKPAVAPRTNAQPAQAAPVAAEAEGPVNLERRAHTRPIPTGLKLGGYLHAQYQRNDISEDQLQQGQSPINQDQFLVRRARLRVDRGWEYVAGTLELDANTVRGPRVGVRRAVEDQNYLRGVQIADEAGKVTFTSIFPACYDGRWPHIHFEVYPSLAKATSSTNKIATSQMALTEEASKAVYATAGYEQSVQNLSQVSLDSDNVFADGYDLQIPAITGDPATGYTLTFTCAV